MSNLIRQAIAKTKKRYYRKPGRPVITGIGVVSPIGIGVLDFWDGLLSGKSGLSKISLFDASEFPSQIAAEVKDFQPERYLNERQVKYYSRGTQFACHAFQLAKQDAAIEFFDPYLTDVIIGAGHISFDSIEEELAKSGTKMLKYNKDMDPAGLLKTSMGLPASAIALMAGVEGYVTTHSTACASGMDAIGFGAERIMMNRAHTVICGGVDTPISRIVLNAFCNAKMLATNNENPDQVLFPFDNRHTKSVLGEGSAVFILEERDIALARRARIYGEIISFSQSAENVNETFFIDKTLTRWAQNVDNTVKKKFGTPDYINAHGPSDKKTDIAEASVIKRVFEAKGEEIPVSSIKGALGSGMAAAGAFQVAASAMTLVTNKIPPTLNYKFPDPDCNLNCSSSIIEKSNIRHVLINAHGMGGINSSILLKEFH
ncbi:MAG: beta-ketoacyl-[acyl-carrier-protein] synthase family protein [Leptospira sp.]|nr:beta-ketoacyl-[acyl-carrier-protein] synthase family protein [Leptospira sp.]